MSIHDIHLQGIPDHGEVILCGAWCVDCFFEDGKRIQACYVYGGRSVCEKHLKVRAQEREEEINGEELDNEEDTGDTA